jgi:hypothetical protein
MSVAAPSPTRPASMGLYTRLGEAWTIRLRAFDAVLGIAMSNPLTARDSFADIRIGYYKTS